MKMTRSALAGKWPGFAASGSATAAAASSPSKPAYYGFQIPERAGRLRVVSRRFVRCVSRAGLTVAVWTVNEEADITRLLDWGVTGVITDRPDLAVPVVRAFGGSEVSILVTKCAPSAPLIQSTVLKRLLASW